MDEFFLGTFKEKLNSALQQNGTTGIRYTNFRSSLLLPFKD
jgi:hypothetical protein